MIRRFKEFLKDNPSFALSIPALLCFAQFIYEIIEIIETRDFDYNALSQLASSANGFEAVCLSIIMIVLKNKR